MNMFDVYPLLDVEPVMGHNMTLVDKHGTEYLDFYGGHAVISIGHGHPHFTGKINRQLGKLAFYSNAVKNTLQEELAVKLGALSGYEDYRLFLCNSGAEANENAMKLASFRTGRKNIIAFRGAFHGRTSAVVAATDNPALRSPLNGSGHVAFLPLNDTVALQNTLEEETAAAVIIEGIQGVGGIRLPDDDFLKESSRLCKKHGTMLILDEVQSGYGRSGRFFAHQYAGIRPDLITVAKGMGNGFPVGGVLIHPAFEAKHGMLGTTFGGNHLACSAAIAVLDVIHEENLLENVGKMGLYLMDGLGHLDGNIKEIRGRGLMIGIELPFPCAGVRKALLQEHHIFTGASSDKNTLRILPPLTVGQKEADIFLAALQNSLREV